MTKSPKNAIKACIEKLGLYVGSTFLGLLIAADNIEQHLPFTPGFWIGACVMLTTGWTFIVYCNSERGE